MWFFARQGLALLLSAALFGIAFAQAPTQQALAEKPKIALYIANETLKPTEKNALTRKFLSPFTASGMYTVIDRSDIFSDKAALERIKQRDGSVNEEEIYKIGYEAGAKYVCMVEFDELFGKWNIGARMVDVVTAEIYLAQGETDIKGKLEDADISLAAKTIFDQIHGRNAGSGGATAQNQQYQTPSAPTAALAQSVVDASGILTDSRDGKRYKTVMIGGKRWMGENMSYQISSESWCYNNANSNCGKYGKLYSWKMAMTVCPAGFHLPSRQEWNNLEQAVSKSAAGKKLKARIGWNKNGNGTDEYGFLALPGGYRRSDGTFFNAGDHGNWWIATEGDGSLAYGRGMYHSYDHVYELSYGKDYGFSVRCVADN